MSYVGIEWAVVLVFLVTTLTLIIFETFWIHLQHWAGFGKSLAFSVVTNLIGFMIGFFVVFVVAGVILAMAWDGSLEKVPAGNYTIGAALILTLLFVPLFLMVCKRIFLQIFKMQTGKRAWIFSLISSFLIIIISSAAPFLVAWLFAKIR